MPTQILIHYMSKDAVPCKHEPFQGCKTKNVTFRPPKSPFYELILDFSFFMVKFSHVNDP